MSSHTSKIDSKNQQDFTNPDIPWTELFDPVSSSDVFFTRWSLNLDSHQQIFNYFSANTSLFGFDPENYLNGTLSWQTIIHPDDRVRIVKDVQQAIEAKQGEYIITYRIKSNDSYKWIQDITTFEIDESENIGYFQSIVIDISRRKGSELELEKKHAYLNLLHETAVSLSQRQSLEKTLNTILEKLELITSSADNFISLLATDKQELKIVAGSGVFSSMLNVSYTKGFSFGAIGAVWKTHKAVYIEDYQNYNNKIVSDHTKDIGSTAALPIFVNDEFFGVIGFNTQEKIHFDKDIREVYLRFAQLVSLAFDNSQLVNELNTKLDEQKLLEKQLRIEQITLANQVEFRTKLSELIEKSLANKQNFGNSRFYEMILTSAMQSISGAEAGSLLIRQVDDSFHFVSAMNYDLEELQTIVLQEHELHFKSNCFQPILHYFIDNSELDEDKQKRLNQNLNELQVSLSIPIHINQKLVALINIDNFSNRDAFKEETVNLAQVFSRHIAALWTRFELEKEIQEQELQYKELFEEASQQTNELSLLSELQHEISKQLELEELFAVSFQKITEIFGYSYSYIRVLDGDQLRLIADDGSITSLLPDTVNKNDPIANQLMEERKLFYLNPENYDAYIDKRTEMFGASTMLLPIIVASEFWGFMGIGNNNKELSEKDIALGHKVVELMSVAIENAQLHDHVKHDLRRNTYIHKISQAVQEYDNLKDLMDNIIQHVKKALNARWAIMYKIDIEQEQIESASTTDLENSLLKILNYEELTSGLGGWAIKNKKVAFAPKNSLDERESPEMNQRVIDLQIGSVAVTPFMYDGKVEGTFAIINHIDDPDFSENDLKLLETIANQVGAAIAKHKLMRRIEHQAFHDSLTGLPNRLQFEKEISSMIDRAQRRKLHFGVLFIDLDGFKHINDTLGHVLGDQLLIEVGKRVQKRKRGEDTLVRMGGDEFAISLNNVSSKEDALSVANDYLKLFLEPYIITGHELNIGASIGVSLYPEDGYDIATLLSNADSAMYQAKNSGKNSVSGFTQSLAEEVKKRAILERELKLAIERDELELHYQPQYNIKTKEMIGLEALVRWRHPEKGLVSPGVFIPIAEESNLIVDVGNWVLFEACRQNAEWQSYGHKALPVAVNISAKQFVKEDFVDTVIAALKQNHLQSEYLELEVTESVIMDDVQEVIQRLQLLQKLNINIAIDDFGTGYSSLTYLQELPLDKLKIDKSFVDKLESSSNPAIIKTILTLAQSLGLTTIAEGVETENQLKLLKDLGCDEAQGFYFAKPLTKEEVFKGDALVPVPNQTTANSQETMSPTQS